MIQISEEQIEAARKTIATGTPEAVGYRLMIKPIDSVSGLEETEKEEFGELAKIGFEKKTKEQAERESKGTQHGIIVSVGEFAYKTEHLGGESWVDVNDVVIFNRYAGVEVELPPGSGEKYRFTNDESILGRVR